MTRPSALLAFLAAVCLSFVPASAQKKSSKPAPPKQESAAAPQYNQALFSGMQWRNIGPFRGGRVLAVEGIPGDPNTYYFGAVSGGIWKTVDGGANWVPLFTHEDVSSIGAIAIAPSDHNILYAGTGEACIRGNISYGDGVYKSVDGGQTWKNVGLKDSRHIGAVIVDPRDPNVVFVAALGHAWGPNPERGIFRTRDGGKTWDKVLYVDDKTGGIDVVFDPHNANILFASMWQVQRGPWYLNSGGPGSGLYKSTDGGSTWKRLSGHGLPDGILGRIGVSVSGADSNRVYALIEANEGGIYRSDDGGDSWTRVNDDERYRQRAWYFTHIFADPQAPDTVYVLNTGLFRSTDGGKTFNLLPAPHGDHHGLWIDPKNPRRMINGNDGGATITTDGGKTWTTQENQPTAQFYHVITDNRFPYYVYGAQQDNSTVGIASMDDEGVIGRQDWYPVGGGESGYIAPWPPDPLIVFANDGGFVSRLDRHTMQLRDISVWPVDESGHGAVDAKYRFQWTEPILVSPHDPNVIYQCGNVVFRTTNQGQSWEVISPDLTRNEKDKQQASGGPITKDNTGVEIYNTIFALAESPVQKGLLWAGTDDGLIHITRDGGGHWQNVTPKGLPESLISIIEPSPFDAGTAYVAVDRHKFDDFKPYIYKTTDFGATWSRIDAGIPEGDYVHSVREDPGKKGLLYAGTEQAPFVSFDDGANWQPLQLNLPRVPIHDLVIHGNDLVAATHGRSFWILDDVTPLRELTSEVASADVVLYKPQTAYRIQLPEVPNRPRPVGKNPPPGAILDYYFKTKPAGEVTLDILDAQGKVVRHYSSQEKKRGEQPPEWPDLVAPPELIPAEAGMNRFAWNYHWEDPVQVPGAFYSGNPPEGPLVVPGTYTLKLTANGKSFTQPLEVKLDPRVKTPEADIQKEFDLDWKIYQRFNDLHIAVNQIRNLRAQLKELKARVGADPKYNPIVEAADSLDKSMLDVEGQLIQYKMKSTEGNLNNPTMLNEMFYGLAQTVESADAPPTDQEIGVFNDLSGKLDQQLARWKALEEKDVPALNQLVSQAGIQVVSVGTGKQE